MSRLLLLFLALAIFCPSAFTQSASPEAVVAINLGTAASTPPDGEWKAALQINTFLRANGEALPVTPTRTSLVWDKDNLYVRFWCADPEQLHRDGARLKRSDAVELLLWMPGTDTHGVWQFHVTEDGAKTARHAGKPSTDFHAVTNIEQNAWTTDISVPWSAIGGKPAAPFYMQLVRSRSISAETLSPSAVDYHDGPAETNLSAPSIDEFMEVSLDGTRGITTASAGLITLPSGVRRWQRRAKLGWPTVGQRAEIWRLQERLPYELTSAQNLGARIRLAELWYSLLEREGLSFHDQSGEWVLEPGQLDPWMARQSVNHALRTGDVNTAGLVLDSLLKHFDGVTRRWFADGSAGSIRNDQWTNLSTPLTAKVVGHEIVLAGKAGERPVEIFLSFPSVGGVRIRGSAQGKFKPTYLLPFQSKLLRNGFSATTNKVAVQIQLKPTWRIQVRGTESGPALWELKQGDLRFRFAESGIAEAVDVAGDLGAGEAIYGLGERFDRFNQRGNTVTLWQQDAWDALSQGGLRNQAYKNIPLWHSTMGYSVFWNSSYKLRADFGCNNSTRYRATVSGPILDLYVWPTSAETALEAYTGLTGRPVLPPQWAFGPWMGGGGERWGRTPGKAPAQEILDQVEHFRQLDIPHTGVYAEGEASSDRALYKVLTPLGIRVFIWSRSQPMDWDGTLRVSEIEQKAWPGVSRDQFPFMRRSDGSEFGYAQPNVLASQYPYIDFTHPRALEYYGVFWKKYMDLGIAGAMVDFGDMVPLESVFHDGTHGDEMHNLYAQSYHRAARQVFEDRRGDDHILFSRGAAPGSQALLCQMAGDHSSNFQGMSETIVGGLNLMSSGFSCWGSDIGGYMGKPDEEVYLRWLEWGTFSPLMRFHGTEPREPWYFSDAAIPVYKHYAWVRENLIGYLESAAIQAHETGQSIMRALPVAFPKQASLLSVDDEYMLGSDLLVVPMHTPGDHRPVTLPAGRWTNLWNGEVLAGGEHDLHVELAEIPVFLRSGALVPLELAPDLKMGESMTAGRVQALLATPPKTFTMTRHAVQVGYRATLSSEPIPDGFRWVVTQWPGLQKLIVTGLPSGKIWKVRANGAKLTYSDSATEGWYTKGERLIVGLPKGANQEIEITADPSH